MLRSALLALIAYIGLVPAALCGPKPFALSSQLEEVSPYSFPNDQELERLAVCALEYREAFFTQAKSPYLKSSGRMRTDTDADQKKMMLLSLQFVDTKKVAIENGSLTKRLKDTECSLKLNSIDPDINKHFVLDLKDYELASGWYSNLPLLILRNGALAVQLEPKDKERNLPEVSIECLTKKKDTPMPTLGEMLAAYGMVDMDLFRASPTACKNVTNALHERHDDEEITAEGAAPVLSPTPPDLKKAIAGQLEVSKVGYIQVGAGYDSAKKQTKGRCLAGEEKFAGKDTSQHTFIGQNVKIKSEESLQFETGTTVSDLWSYLENPKLMNEVEALTEKNFKKACGDMYVAAVEYGAERRDIVSIYLLGKKAEDTRNFANAVKKRKFMTNASEPQIDRVEQMFDEYVLKELSKIGLTPTPENNILIRQSVSMGTALSISARTLPFLEAVKTLPSAFKFRKDKRDREPVAIRLLPYPKPKKKRPQDKTETESDPEGGSQKDIGGGM